MKPLRWVNSRPALAMIADVLVAHDGGLVVRRMRVELDVGAADAGDLHLHQRAVRRDIRHRDIRGFRSCSARSARPPALFLPLQSSISSTMSRHYRTGASRVKPGPRRICCIGPQMHLKGARRRPRAMSDYTQLEAWQTGKRPSASGACRRLPHPPAFKRTPSTSPRSSGCAAGRARASSLPEDAAVLVAEVACAVPGLPAAGNRDRVLVGRAAAPFQGVQAGRRGGRGRSSAVLVQGRARRGRRVRVRLLLAS